MRSGQRSSDWNGIGEQLQQAPDGQISLTDPDARSMASAGRGTGIVGYNVQTAVEVKHHLIVAHEVSNVGTDRTHLSSMAERAREGLGTDQLTVLADRGYFKGEEILDCDRAGITPLVPKPLTSNSKADGRFDKRDFVYIAERDEYRCPAGERAIWRMTTVEHGRTLHRYWPSACPKCPIKQQCIPLCANMDETPAFLEISVEGGGGNDHGTARGVESRAGGGCGGNGGSP